MIRGDIMEYNSCTVSFPKTIQAEHKAISADITGIYNSSFLGNICPLFEELDQISEEMAQGNRVKIDL